MPRLGGIFPEEYEVICGEKHLSHSLFIVNDEDFIRSCLHCQYLDAPISSIFPVTV